MIKKTVSVLLAALTVLSFAACNIKPQPVESSVTSDSSATSDSSKELPEVRIKLFETSDIHGTLMDTSSGKEENYQYRMAYIAKIISDARNSDEFDDVMLLDCGDIYTGTTQSTMVKGAHLRAAMDIMDYDVMELGNHEFDWGVLNNVDEDATPAAYDFAGYKADPDTPVIASNLYYEGTSERVDFSRDYAVVEKAGKRIAVIGFLSKIDDFGDKSSFPACELDWKLDHLSERVKEINAQESPDATIVLAHQDPVLIADALDPADVDLVAGGHTHNGIYGRSGNGIPYIQCDSHAQGYASSVIVFDKNGNVSAYDPHYTDIKADKNKFLDRPENSGFLDPDIMTISRAALEVEDEVIGYIDHSIEKHDVVSDNGATSAGNWITSLMLRATADLNTVASFYNKGGIATSFYIPGGEESREISLNDVYAISSYGNSLLVYELTGKEIAKQLKDGFKNDVYGDQMSGLTFEYIDHRQEERKDVEIVSITLSDGTKIDPEDNETLYRVVTTNYNASVKGSVFEGKTSVVPENEAPVDNEAFVKVLKQEAADNNGYIKVDLGVRGIDVGKKK
ncbi:MAG: 5'-nucleotidase C-terminal domain-containing protein [Clostridiales bacterium]|nr:5'-nucleotidase C-terminal domain-containing protein [Clostridiales bacterium]